MDEGDAMTHTAILARGGQGHEKQENVDYDVANDNDRSARRDGRRTFSVQSWMQRLEI